MGALCTTAAVKVTKTEQIESVPSTQDISGAQDISGVPVVNQEDPSSDPSGSIKASYDTLIQTATTARESIPDTTNAVSTSDTANAVSTPSAISADITRNIEQYKENAGISEKQ